MDYGNIARAVDFYKERGYVYLDDVPWYVGKEAYYATKPEAAVDISLSASTEATLPTHMGYPVASGEQSFLQMMIDGQPIKRAICVTPCFRHEPKVDMLHRRYFMKAELINAQDVDEGHLIHMVHDACNFFEQYFAVRVVKTEIGYDIVEKGSRFELGSYGIRDLKVPRYEKSVNRGDLYAGVRHFRWIYGTACAEPRLTTAIQKHLKHVGR